MKNVYILSGASGSGKSFYAERMISGCRSQRDKVSAVVISAEDYLPQNFEYHFDGSAKLHEQCFKQFIFAMQAGFDLIFVDNTNTTVAEISPYVVASGSFGYEHSIITFQCRNMDDVRVAAARNKHKIPFEQVFLQHNRICDRRFLPWWNFVDVNIEHG